MRGIQKCNEMGLMVKNVRARIFEKGAFPKCPVPVCQQILDFNSYTFIPDFT
jgi:hypothetical protein